MGSARHPAPGPAGVPLPLPCGSRAGRGWELLPIAAATAVVGTLAAPARAASVGCRPFALAGAVAAVYTTAAVVLPARVDTRAYRWWIDLEGGCPTLYPLYCPVASTTTPP